MRPIDVIGVPSSVGMRNNGAREGPDAFEEYGIEGRLQEHVGPGTKVTYRNMRKRWEYDMGKEYVDAILDPKEAPTPPVYYRKEVEAVCARGAVEVFRSLRVGNLPLVIGGDHSISIGTNGEFVRFAIRQRLRPGLLWLDAHLDAHTDRTSRSHNANGEPLAALLGYGVLARKIKECVPLKRTPWEKTKKPRRLWLKPSQVFHVGAGEDDCEEEEKDFFARHKIMHFDMPMLMKKDGWDKLRADLSNWLEGIDTLAVSVDLDVFHAHWAPGVSYPRLSDGLLRNEGLSLAELVRKSGKLGHLELMEHNPLNEESDPAREPRTAEFGTELACAMFK